MKKCIVVYGVFDTDSNLLCVKKTMKMALENLSLRRSCGRSGAYVAKCFLSKEVGYSNG